MFHFRKFLAEAHLIFVTAITTAGCLKDLAKFEILQSERKKKLLYTQCV